MTEYCDSGTTSDCNNDQHTDYDNAGDSELENERRTRLDDYMYNIEMCETGSRLSNQYNIRQTVRVLQYDRDLESSPEYEANVGSRRIHTVFIHDVNSDTSLISPKLPMAPPSSPRQSELDEYHEYVIDSDTDE